MAEILGSWKEIAAYFGRSVRTVQRWEKTHRLPVSRPVDDCSKIVFADSHDLEAWLRRNGDPDGAHVSNKVLLMVCERTMERRELRDALEDAGYLVLSCPCWDRAKEILLSGPRVDLLLIEAPPVVTNGSDAGESRESVSIPVVHICVSDEDCGEHLGRENWRVLREPVEPERLLGAVDELLWV